MLAPSTNHAPGEKTTRTRSQHRYQTDRIARCRLEKYLHPSLENIAAFANERNKSREGDAAAAWQRRARTMPYFTS